MESRTNIPNGAPVPAQLATGNRNMTHIPTTVAEAAPTVQMTEVRNLFTIFLMI